jgi:hypothetical protein
MLENHSWFIEPVGHALAASARRIGEVARSRSRTFSLQRELDPGPIGGPENSGIDVAGTL